MIDVKNTTVVCRNNNNIQRNSLSLYLANYLGKIRKSKFKYLNSDSFSDFFVKGIDTFVLPMVITTSYNFYNCFTKHIK